MTEVADTSVYHEQLREELKEELAGLNRRLADANSRAWQVEDERRTLQRRLVQVSKDLQALDAADVKGQFAAGRYPKTENVARRR